MPSDSQKACMQIQADSLSGQGILGYLHKGKTMTAMILTSATSRKGAASLRIALAAVCLLSLGACTSMSYTQQRVTSGAVLGAAAGAGITAITGGCISCGTAIGTAVGAGVGYIVDRANQ